MKKYAIFVLLLMTAFMACSERDNPVEPAISAGDTNTGFLYSSNLQNTILGEVAGRYVYIYKPPEYAINNTDSFELYVEREEIEGGYPVHIDTTFIIYHVTDTDYPTLYLLHGYGGSYNYFEDIYMLENTLNEMISSGEIIPMVVVTPDASNLYGGSYYSNSPYVHTALETTLVSIDTLVFTYYDSTYDTTINVTAYDTTYSGSETDSLSFTGYFEDFIVEDLIEYINLNFNVDTIAATRGISGHSMGGYGAIKLAMKHPELFGSVSSMSAPLAFSGIEQLIPAVFFENSLTPGDTPGFYNINFSADKRITSMMFAMGSAFSPYRGFISEFVTYAYIDSIEITVIPESESTFTVDLDTSFINRHFINPDTTYFHRTKDTTAFYGVELPFDVNGELADSSTVWQKWLANDPYTMLDSADNVTALTGKPIYLDCGDFDDLGLNLQNQAFAQKLGQSGLDYTYEEYSGYAGNDAGHSNYIAERLRKILKFHSDAFIQASQSQ